MNNVSYACINMTLQSQGVYTGRSMIQRIFRAKGLDYVSELALANVKDLKKIIEWNIANNLPLFRMSSDIFPWHSEYQFSALRDFVEISFLLREIGGMAVASNHRLSFHPDHFNKLGSPKEEIVQKTMLDIERHSQIFNLMGFKPSRYNKINIHVGGAYGDKTSALLRFCKNFKRLSDHAQARLTVENDDRLALFSVYDLFKYVHLEIGIPIVFDYHHHKFNTSGLTEQQAFELAYGTWGNIIPVFHYSESREENERAHSDYVQCSEISTYGKDVFIILEAKAKELAVLKFLERKRKKLKIEEMVV